MIGYVSGMKLTRLNKRKYMKILYEACLMTINVLSRLFVGLMSLHYSVMNGIITNSMEGYFWMVTLCFWFVIPFRVNLKKSKQEVI